jgi:Ca2+-binding EF-hand superfamily protein
VSNAFKAAPCPHPLGDLTFWKDSFANLDDDGSGALSFGELASMVRALGALATAGDIETMLWEVGGWVSG